MNILLVDDHVDTTTIMSLLLRQRGHTVTVATSVRGALDFLARHFDLLISDLGLPDGSGLEIMRAFSRENRIAGIAVSGHSSDEDLERSRLAGFKEHLSKPIDLPSLLSAIDRITKGMPAVPQN
ncbi:MAG TPA: response regulator [Tepidisphaeraceae bacterium]|jgi:CheY-like chemotaxis protein|nr:response regulator [Tepidisphaeraceae bacterium]